MKRLEDKFWEKVLRTDGCWMWEGATLNGYGVLGDSRRGTRDLAHRISYQLLVGKIPKGRVLHHLCEEKKCVRPDHLVLLTKAGHARLHANQRTHCKHGHPVSEINTYTSPQGFRFCRVCRRGATRRYRAKRK